MADYTYSTTDEMDTALTFEADKQGKTAEELFDIIVTADMGTLVRNNQEVIKQRLYDAYQNANPEDKAAIDVVVAKVTPVSPIDVKPVPIQPVKDDL